MEKGGTISVPHKSKINEWYGELKISKLGKNEYVIQPYWQKFSDIDDAVNWFMDKGLTSKNKGYIQNRLRDKGLLDDSCDYRDWETDRKSTRLNSSHSGESRMPSSA